MEGWMGGRKIQRGSLHFLHAIKRQFARADVQKGTVRRLRACRQEADGLGSRPSSAAKSHLTSGMLLTALRPGFLPCTLL